MGAFYLYRGKLHRPADVPRVWQMPPRAITLSQFRELTARRDRAIARLAEERRREEEAAAAAAAEAGAASSDVDRKNKGKELAVEEEGGVEKMESDEVAAEENGGKGPEEQPARVEAAPADSTVVVKMEESKTYSVSDREKRKQEVEKKLQVLKEKKHNLVQILKLILNAEEEFKRRNAQSAALRPSVPLQVENPVDMGSVTRHVPKLSVEVNFGGDSGAESDATANPNSHGRQVHHLHSTSPSAGPLARPSHGSSHQNATTPRTSLVATGHGTPSNILTASGAATATSSPSRFAPTGHHVHHQSSSLPPVSAPGAQFAASSLSPAASGGASSAFKDSRLTNSS